VVPQLTIPILVVLVAAVVAAVTDVARFKVYNLLTFPLLFSGLLYHGVTGGPVGLAASAAGAAAGFAVLILFYILGGMGAGDVKLLTAVGAWLGLPLVFYVFIASSLAAGVYALGVILVRQQAGETWLNLLLIWQRLCVISRHLRSGEGGVEQEAGRGNRARIIPFAAMVAIGFVAVLVWSWCTRSQ
jgi:prepilin peptidase CpaA